MLEEKNETIIRLKSTGGKGGGFNADMVRVLNKKLSER
jgi:hypothetical protein